MGDPGGSAAHASKVSKMFKINEKKLQFLENFSMFFISLNETIAIFPNIFENLLEFFSKILSKILKN